MAGKERRRASVSNRRGMVGIALVVLVLLSVFIVQSHKLSEKNAAFEQQIVQLQEQIELENERTKELEELPEYTKSREYIEKVAREKFGLVYEDEIIFRPEE